jgi:hypothetical protein
MIPDGRIGYLLHLGKGHKWYITATAGEASWLEAFASILGLRPGAPGGEPKLIFLGREPHQKGCENPVDRVDPEILRG